MTRSSFRNRLHWAVVTSELSDNFLSPICKRRGLSVTRSIDVAVPELSSAASSSQCPDGEVCTACAQLCPESQTFPCRHVYCSKCLEKVADARREGECHDCPMERTSYASKESLMPPTNCTSCNSENYRLQHGRKFRWCDKQTHYTHLISRLMLQNYNRRIRATWHVFPCSPTALPSSG